MHTPYRHKRSHIQFDAWIMPRSYIDDLAATAAVVASKSKSCYRCSRRCFRADMQTRRLRYTREITTRRVCIENNVLCNCIRICTLKVATSTRRVHKIDKSEIKNKRRRGKKCPKYTSVASLDCISGHCAAVSALAYDKII